MADYLVTIDYQTANSCYSRSTVVRSAKSEDEAIDIAQARLRRSCKTLMKIDGGSASLIPAHQA